MWLLNTQTIKLEFFHSEVNAPKYAILSHTWDEEEVAFQEIETVAAVEKKGYSKIEGTCRLARDSGIEYVWIDTCK